MSVRTSRPDPESHQPERLGVGVEAREAQPRDAAVEADERRSRSVADQAHVLEREVAVAAAHRAKRRVSANHGSSRFPVRSGSAGRIRVRVANLEPRRASGP